MERSDRSGNENKAECNVSQKVWRYLVSSTVVPICKNRYPVHFEAVDVKCTRAIVDQVFSVPKCVRQISEKS